MSSATTNRSRKNVGRAVTRRGYVSAKILGNHCATRAATATASADRYGGTD
jgi:hypothetical protein